MRQRAASGDRNFGFDGATLGGITSVRVNGQPIVAQPGNGRGDNRLSNLIDRNFGNIAATIPTLNASTDGQTWIGTMGVRYEPTTQTARFRPYVSGGLGVNFTESELLAGRDVGHAGHRRLSVRTLDSR